MVTSIQDLDSRFPIVNEDGTPTEYFMRLINDRGLSQQEDQEGLAGKADKTTQIIAGGGLSGGGDLSQDRTLNLNAVLGDLTDVDMTTTPPTDGQAPIWSDADQLWLPGDAGGGGGGGSTKFHGARATIDSSVVITTTGSWVNKPLLSEVVDTDGFLDLATNSRFTIPAGVSRVRFVISVWRVGSDPIINDQHKLFKNGALMSASDGSYNIESHENGYNNSGMSGVSAVLDVTEGDYFEARCYIGDSGSFGGWVELQVIEGSILGGGGGGSFEFIAEIEADGTSPTLTLGSIPAGYAALELRYHGATTTAVAAEECWIQFNGDASTVYDYDRQYGGSSNGGATYNNSTAFAVVAYMNGNADQWSSGSLTLPNYDTSDQVKSIYGIGRWDNITVNWGGMWKNLNPVTSISFTLQGAGNFRTGSRLQLWGLKAEASGGGGSGWTEIELVNNDFATGDLTGWTSGAGSFSVGAVSPSPTLSGFIANAGANSVNDIYQEVDLTAYATDIDNLNLEVRGDVWWRSTYTDGDHGAIMFIFYDDLAATTELGRVLSASGRYTEPSGVYVTSSARGIAPVNARMARVYGRSVRSSGTNCDADLFSLRAFCRPML